MGFNFENFLFRSFALLLITSCSEIKDKEFEQNHPNIIFISIDDLRPSLGVYGDSIVHSPNIDLFAKEAFVFRNTFCQSAVCVRPRAYSRFGGSVPWRCRRAQQNI